MRDGMVSVSIGTGDDSRTVEIDGEDALSFSIALTTAARSISRSIRKSSPRDVVLGASVLPKMWQSLVEEIPTNSALTDGYYIHLVNDDPNDHGVDVEVTRRQFDLLSIFGDHREAVERLPVDGASAATAVDALIERVLRRAQSQGVTMTRTDLTRAIIEDRILDIQT